MRKTLAVIAVLTGVIFVYGSGLAEAALPDNLQGYWHFDHAGVGGNPDWEPDSSGNGYYLRPWESNMVVRSPLYDTNGVVGQASDLDYHRTSQFGEFWQNGPAVPNLRITGDITMMAWFYPREFGSSNRHLLGTYSTSGDNRSYLLNWTPGGAVGMTLDSDGLSGSSNITISGVQLNTWNLAVGVLDGNDMKIYLAAITDANMPAPVTGTHTGGIYASTAPFRIGLRADWPEPVNGLVDEMAVWDRALSSAEIDELFARGKAGVEIDLDPAVDCNDVWDSGDGLAGDLDRNCYVDRVDLALLVEAWLTCNDPADSNCF